MIKAVRAQEQTRERERERDSQRKEKRGDSIRGHILLGVMTIEIVPKDAI